MELEDRLVVAVIGSTGVGKSKLGIELAKQFDGEVVSADSMQVYNGLDIATNKVTPDETEGVPHHMIGFADPYSQYSVIQYRSSALGIIQDIMARGKLPIIVGGTNYYIESLLWRTPLDFMSPDSATSESAFNLEGRSQYDLLTTLDPRRARGIHPSDHRKISRALVSSITQRESSSSSSSNYPLPCRFRKACMFWLCCQEETLVDRIKARTRNMVDRGIVLEVTELYERCRVLHGFKDPFDSMGVFQSIGFKEFRPYFASEDPDVRQDILRNSLDQVVRNTVRYSKKQTKWFTNKFLSSTHSPIDVYRLDTTDPSRWKADVQSVAIHIVSRLLLHQKPEYTPLARTVTVEGLDPHQPFVCDCCDGKVLIGTTVYQEHIRSRAHQKRRARRNRGIRNGVLVADLEASETGIVI